MLLRRVEGPPAEVEVLLRQVEEELSRVVRARQGPPMVVVKPCTAEGSPASNVSVDVMLPVAPGTPAPAGFEVKSLPAQPVAYTIHHGRAENLSSAEAVLSDWVQMKALRLAGELRRIYVKRGKNPKKDITEIQIPLAR